MTQYRSGLERRLDAMGRLVIPAEIREVLGLAPGDAVDISVRDGAVVLAPIGERCPHCGHVRSDHKDRTPLHAVPPIASLPGTST